MKWREGDLLQPEDALVLGYSLQAVQHPAIRAAVVLQLELALHLQPRSRHVHRISDNNYREEDETALNSEAAKADLQCSQQPPRTRCQWLSAAACLRVSPAALQV